MSARTISQLVSDRIVTKLRTEGNLNTTFFIDDSLDAGLTNISNAVADEMALDAQITSRKVTALPTAFDANDATVVLSYNSSRLIKSGFKDKIKFAADIKFIIGYYDFFNDDEFENFVVVDSAPVVSPGATPRDRIEYQFKVFKREKVFVR